MQLPQAASLWQGYDSECRQDYGSRDICAAHRMFSCGAIMLALHGFSVIDDAGFNRIQQSTSERLLRHRMKDGFPSHYLLR
jgi:hypothetical protein